MFGGLEDFTEPEARSPESSEGCNVSSSSGALDDSSGDPAAAARTVNELPHPQRTVLPAAESGSWASRLQEGHWIVRGIFSPTFQRRGSVNSLLDDPISNAAHVFPDS